MLDARRGVVIGVKPLAPSLPGLSPELYPFQGKFCTIEGHRLHYLDEGRGEPVLMVHGNPSWSFYYRNLIPGLREHYRCIVPDHVGCGLSDKPNDDAYSYTLSRRVADLEALIDPLDLRQPLTLILHDWGGMIGMTYAHRHPERIGRIILLNTAAFPLPAGKSLPRSIWLGRNTPVGSLLIRGCNAFCKGAAHYGVCTPLSRAVRAGYLAPYNSWSNRVAVQRFVEDIPLGPGHPTHALIEEVQASLHQFRDRPLLICWGDHDFVFDHHFLAEWRRRFPEAQVHRFADAGHYVLEDAGDRILPLIREFLARNPLPTSIPAIRSVNIASAIPDRARLQPTTPALIEPRGLSRPRQWTFADLDRETDQIARGLQQLGIGPGTRCVVMVPPSLEFYSVTFALFKVGAVVVLIDPGMGIKNLGACLADAQPDVFLGIPRGHVARFLFGWGKSTLRTWVTVGAPTGWGGISLRQVQRMGQQGSPVLSPLGANDLAAILFTSGSTGIAKGVEYTHGIFIAQVEQLQKLYNIQPGEIDLPTFPLFGLFAPALGMTAVIPEMDATRPGSVDPDRILDTIDRHGVTNLFGSPALIRRVGRHGNKNNRKLPTLRRVISAGAPVPLDALRRFQSLLSDGISIHTPYGATEALPVASIDSQTILASTGERTSLGHGVCVGCPVPDVSVRIIQISDEPIARWDPELVVPPGTIGEIVVKGPVVTRAYYNRPDSTRLAKIADAEGQFWHRMGDVGYLDDEGRLWFCGRKSQRVITPTGTLFTIPCEGVFNAHPAVFRSALVGVKRQGTIQPVLCVELDPEVQRPGKDLIRQQLLSMGSRHEHTRPIQTILFHPRFPVDIRHNAKIFREKLALWAAGKLS